MATTVGEVIIRLIGDSSSLKGSLSGAKSQLDAEAKRIGESAGSALGEGTKRGLSGMVGGVVDAFGKIGLAAMGLQAAGNAIKSVFAAPIMAASDLNEAANKTDVVFGKAAGSIHEFAKTAAQSLGMSRTQAESAAGTFGNLFVSMGLGQGQASDMSKSILTLAADLASFNNIDPTEALDKLRAGLVGETEPLRSLGVNLNEAAIAQEAMRLGLSKTGKDLTAAQKAQAAYSLIMQQTRTAQGDFARTSTGMANALRIIKASWADIVTEVGNRFLPLVAPLISAFAKALPAAFRLVTPLLDRFGKVASSVARAAGVFVGLIRDIVSEGGDLGVFADDVRELTGINLSGLVSAFRNILRPIQAFARYVQVVVEDGDDLNDFLSELPRFLQPIARAFGQTINVLRTFGRYIQAAAADGDAFNDFLSDLPPAIRPLAEIIGSLVGGFRELADTFLELLAGEINLSQFFGRVIAIIKVKGQDILDAFGNIGKAIWDYLFARDDAGGQTKAGALIARVKTWLATAAKTAFSAAAALALDLYDWLFGVDDKTGSSRASAIVARVKSAVASAARTAFSAANALRLDLLTWVFGAPSGGEGQSDSGAVGFFQKHKAALKVAAGIVFGPLGALAVSVLDFIFGGKAGGEQQTPQTFLESVKNSLVIAAIGVFETGVGIVKDVYGFLFGGTGSDGAWAPGVVQKIGAAIKTAFDTGSPVLVELAKVFGIDVTKISESLPNISPQLTTWLRTQFGNVDPKQIYSELPPPPAPQGDDKGWLGNLLDGINRGLADVWKAISDWFAVLPENTRKLAVSIANSELWGQAGAALAKALWDGIAFPIKVQIEGTEKQGGLGKVMGDSLQAQLKNLGWFFSNLWSEAEFAGGVIAGIAQFIAGLLGELTKQLQGDKFRDPLRREVGAAIKDAMDNPTIPSRTGGPKVMPSPLPPGEGSTDSGSSSQWYQRGVEIGQAVADGIASMAETVQAAIADLLAPAEGPLLTQAVTLVTGLGLAMQGAVPVAFGPVGTEMGSSLGIALASAEGSMLTAGVALVTGVGLAMVGAAAVAMAPVGVALGASVQAALASASGPLTSRGGQLMADLGLVMTGAALVSGAGIGAAFGESLIGALASVWPVVQAGTETAWSRVQAYVASVFASLVENARRSSAEVTSVLSAAWRLIQALTVSVWTAVLSVIRTAMAAAQVLVSSGTGQMSGAFSSMSATIKAVLASLYAAVNSIMSLIQSRVALAASSISSQIARIRSQLSALQASASSTLSGFRASGGPVWPGGAFVVGERGPEVFVPRSAGTIVPAARAASGTTIHAPITITVSGNADPEAIARAIDRRLSDLVQGNVSRRNRMTLGYARG